MKAPVPGGIQGLLEIQVRLFIQINNHRFINHAVSPHHERDIVARMNKSAAKWIIVKREPKNGGK